MNVTLSGITSAVATPLGDLRNLRYTPPNALPATVFPQAAGRDYNFQTRMILEKWRRMYPGLPYYSLKVDPTPAVIPPDFVTPAGRNGTLIDPLYNEPVPQGVVSLKDDPHLLASGGNPKVLHDAVTLNIGIILEARDDLLKQWGFDRIRDVVAIIPLAMLDQVGITVKIGDEIQWVRQNYPERFEVLQYTLGGYWKNTTSKFFMIMNCQSVTQES